MVKDLAILWTTLLEYECVLLSELSELHGARTRQVHATDLPAAIGAELRVGAVVVLACGDRQASQALALGADEVVRSGELTARNLDDAIQRALVRAAARRSRESQRALTDASERMAFALLAAAIGHELTESLHPAMRTLPGARGVLNVAQQLAAGGGVAGLSHWPAIGDEPFAARTLEAVDSLGRADSLLGALERLGWSAGRGLPVRVSEFLREFSALMEGYIRPWAAVSVSTEGDGHASVPRVLLTCSLSAVLAGAVGEIRRAQRSDGWIELRCCEREDCVLLEVEHNGALGSSDLRAAAHGSPFAGLSTAQSSVCDLASVREHLRQVGGELLVDSSEERTLIRLFLPTARALVPAASVSEPPAPRRRPERAG